jgi:hypothetical protein
MVDGFGFMARGKILLLKRVFFFRRDGFVPSSNHSFECWPSMLRVSTHGSRHLLSAGVDRSSQKVSPGKTKKVSHMMCNQHMNESSDESR